jgi:hypothetical protein
MTRVAFLPMATLVTIVCELALPGLLWLLWHQARRADQEIETLTQGRLANYAQGGLGALKSDSW